MVWKSDYQGVKEETFTQTSRRDRDRQQGHRGLVTKVTDQAGKAVAGGPVGPTLPCE